jgi:hypothetical protein
MTIHTLPTPTKVWSAKIYSNGWKKPALGTADVIEKATGAKLGEIGIASPEEVSATATTWQSQRTTPTTRQAPSSAESNYFAIHPSTHILTRRR